MMGMLDLPGYLPQDQILAREDILVDKSRLGEARPAVERLSKYFGHDVKPDLTPKESSRIERIRKLLAEVLEVTMEDPEMSKLLSSDIRFCARAATDLQRQAIAADVKQLGSIVGARDDLFVAGFQRNYTSFGGQLVDLTSAEADDGPAHFEPVVRGVEGETGLLPVPVRLFGVHVLRAVDPVDKVLIMHQRQWEMTELQRYESLQAYDRVRGL